MPQARGPAWKSELHCRKKIFKILPADAVPGEARGRRRPLVCLKPIAFECREAAAPRDNRARRFSTRKSFAVVRYHNPVAHRAARARSRSDTEPRGACRHLALCRQRPLSGSEPNFLRRLAMNFPNLPIASASASEWLFSVLWVPKGDEWRQGLNFPIANSICLLLPP
jgi:hypothetical protein